jgi:hypothetical protein
MVKRFLHPKTTPVRFNWRDYPWGKDPISLGKRVMCMRPHSHQFETGLLAWTNVYRPFRTVPSNSTGQYAGIAGALTCGIAQEWRSRRNEHACRNTFDGQECGAEWGAQLYTFMRSLGLCPSRTRNFFPKRRGQPRIDLSLNHRCGEHWYLAHSAPLCTILCSRRLGSLRQTST